MESTLISNVQFESLQRYLEADSQQHIQSSGKWRPDAGKLEAALESAGILVAHPDENTTTED